MLEFLLVLCVLVIGALVWVLFRLLNNLNQVDNIMESLSVSLSTLYTMASHVLEGEIYSNEPTLIAFIDQLKRTNETLVSYDEFFNIKIQGDLSIYDEEDTIGEGN